MGAEAGGEKDAFCGGRGQVGGNRRAKREEGQVKQTEESEAGLGREGMRQT